MNFISKAASTQIALSLSLCLGLSIGTMQPLNAQNYSGSNSSFSMGGSTQSQQKGALGLVVNWNPQGQLTVTNVVPAGPAGKAGISVGDRLLAIDGANIQGLPANQVFARIQGAVGTTSTLSLSSPTRGNYQAKLTRVTVQELQKSSSFDIGWQPAGAPAANNNNNNNTNSGGYSNSSGGYSNSTGGYNNSANTAGSSGNASNQISGNSYNSNPSGGVSWNTYGGADQGFTVKYPQGWTVNQDNKSGKVEVKSPNGSQLSVLPFFIPSNKLNVSQSQSLFTVLLKRFAPGVNWSNPMMMGGALRSMSTDNNINSIAGLALSAGNSGTAGRLIIFQVPNNANSQSDLNYLSQILQTLNITGGTLPASAGSATGQDGADYADGSGQSNYAQLPYQNVQFTKYVDPNFGSFSLDVPAGWNVTGGMKKPMAVDLRPWMKAVSPDQKISVFIGDGSIEPRYLPAGWLTWMGCPPGATYKVSSGLVTKVLYYQTADKFIQHYVKTRLAKACDSIELVNVEHHPDLARSINGTQGVVAGDCASLKYNFSIKGNEGEAYFLAATKKGKTMWWVSQICGVLAVRGYEEQALNVFLRMYQSWQWNPQWNQAQGRQNVQFTQNWMAYDSAARARSAAAFRSRMAAMDARHEAFRSRMRSMDAAHSSYMNRVRSSDRAHSDFINFIRDEDTLVNPSTGTQYQVEYGPKYHWVNSTGDTVLGTDSAWSPGVDWTELVTPPR